MRCGLLATDIGRLLCDVSLRSGLRQRHEEPASAARLAFKPDSAALEFDQFPGNREPQARAFVNRRGGAMKFLKDFVVVLAWDPAAGVGEGDGQTVVLRHIRS